MTLPQIDILLNGFGTAYSGGTATVYYAGTTTLAAIYSDAAGTTLATNPITLNANGSAIAYSNRRLKIDVKNSLSVSAPGFPVDNIGYGIIAPDVYIADSYATIADAVTAIGSSVATLYVPSGTYAITADLTIPKTLKLNMDNGAIFSISSGKILTINGDFNASSSCFSGAGTVSFSVSNVQAVRPEWWGAIADGTTDCTTALQAAYNTHKPISLSIGTYLFSTLTVTAYPLIMRGCGDLSILQQSATAAIGLDLGTGGIEKSILEDFWLKGNSTAIGGIRLGNGTTQSGYTYGNYCAFTVLNRVRITDYTNATSGYGYGIALNQVQECDISNCYLKNNKNNIYYPSTTYGFITSTRISGASSYIGYATNIGVLLEGLVTDISITEGVVLEGNSKEAIRSTAAGSDISLFRCYFEENNAGAGSGVIHVSGTGAGDNLAILSLRECSFRGTPHGVCVSADYTWLLVDGSRTLFSGGVTTTANTTSFFENNATAATSADPFTAYNAILGSVHVIDRDSVTGRITMQGPKVVTSWTNDSGTPYSTLTSTGSNITSAIILTAVSGYANSNTFTTVAGRMYTVLVKLTKNSGETPTLYVKSGAGTQNITVPSMTSTGIAFSYVEPNGGNASQIVLGNSAATNYSAIVEVREH